MHFSPLVLDQPSDIEQGFGEDFAGRVYACGNIIGSDNILIKTITLVWTLLSRLAVIDQGPLR